MKGYELNAACSLLEFIYCTVLQYFILYVALVNQLICMQTRKRVLVNAFTVRALRDTFPPARGAGILTLFVYLFYSQDCS